MSNITKLSFLLLTVGILCFSFGTAVLAQTLPQVQTISATNVQSTSATLNENLISLGVYGSANVYFQWGIDSAFQSGSNSYQHQTPDISQSYTGPSSITISGLSQNTPYHFRAVAQNTYGITYGQDMAFFTGQNDGGSPFATVQTTYATYVSSFQATMNGLLSNPYLYSTNFINFEWGTTTSYGNETPQQPLGYAGIFFQNIANLNPGTTYHYRAVAQGNYGTVYGQDMTFTTTGINPGVVGAVPTVSNTVGQVLGASSVSTGLTNDILTDSFLIPLLMIIFGLWFYFSGEIYVVADKVKAIIKR